MSIIDVDDQSTWPPCVHDLVHGWARQVQGATRFFLDVPLPPDAVTDVADYFLFDLQRGYCDYYATAFVVLARMAGLPTRFVTGFAVGAWDASEGVFVVTEAEAHSWPEVYFPDYGWIAFEPTGGRPELVRVGLPTAASGSAMPAEMPEIGGIDADTIVWNWEMLFWLLPLGLLIWGAIWFIGRWRRRREDPWTALLQWGTRWGRPMSADETTLEYGHALGDHIHEYADSPAEARRTAAREVGTLSDEVTLAHYGPTAARATAVEAVSARWATLRSRLRQLRFGKKSD